MTTLSHQLLAYALQSILVSGVCYGYYRFLLRNRHFHGFNRLFLLAIPLLSLTLPFIHLPLGGYLWPASTSAHSPFTPQGLSIVTEGKWQETDGKSSAAGTALLSYQTLTAVLYTLVAGILLYLFFRQILYIRQLRRRHPGEKMGKIQVFDTQEPDAPFSFLHYIFWNDEIDKDSPLGRQIFRHELNHVRQRHSLDLLYLKPLIALCWINPFFHLILREIKAVHEFLADNDAISEGDRYQYAEGLLWQTVRNPASSLVHPFFQSSIKRRIIMITQSKNTRAGLLSRAMILPLLFLLFCAFASNRRPYPNVPITIGAAPFTVVIDAGHGGIDPGATSKSGIQEKNLNLAIAEKIKQLSGEYNVHVLMTREDDQLAGGKSSVSESLHYRADLANDNKADLFISIHTDMAATDYVKGFNIFVTQKNAHYAQCVKLGNTLTSVLQKTYTTDVALKQRTEGIYVLSNTNMPAVLLLCGNLNSEKDLSFISKEDNQEKVARDILESIRKYADAR